jgi:hypothetical protein
MEKRVNQIKVFPQDDIENIRKNHFKRIRELKELLDDWEIFLNSKFEELRKDYESAKHTRNKNTIENFSLKIKSFLKEDCGVIDNYLVTIKKSISNKLKGQKKSKGESKEFYTSQKIEERIDRVCEEIMSTSRSNIQSSPKENLIIPKKVQKVEIGSEPHSIKIFKEFYDKINIEDRLFIFLKEKCKKILGNYSSNKPFFILIEVENYTKIIIDYIKKFFERFIAYKGDEREMSLIGGSTKKLDKILDEIERLVSNRKLTLSIQFLRTYDDIYNHFERKNLPLEKIEFQ